MNRPITNRVVSIAVLVLALWSLNGLAASAATEIHVTTAEDELNSDGDCSLREAIRAANFDAAVDACPAGDGADTIVLPEGHYLLSHPDGALVIWSDVILRGAGATSTIIDADAHDRVIRILPPQQAVANPQISMLDITITGGVTDQPGGGMVITNADVLLERVIVRDNHSAVLGGGITTSGGRLTLVDSQVRGNTASQRNAVQPCGGGIANLGSADPSQGGGYLELRRSIIENNRAGDWIEADVSLNPTGGNGGGVCNRFGEVHVLDGSVIRENLAGDGVGTRLGGASAVGGSGGGIFSFRGDVVLEESSVIGNVGGSASGRTSVRGGFGGGIFVSDGNLRLTSCRIEQNRAGDAHESSTMAIGGYGGAIHVRNGHLHVEDCSIESNSAGEAEPGIQGAQARGGFGGAIYGDSCTMDIVDSNIADNRAGDGTSVGYIANGGEGGALSLLECSLNVEASALVRNAAGAGDGATVAIGGVGGAISARGEPDHLIAVTQSEIADNLAGSAIGPAGAQFVAGGDGGGFSAREVTLTVDHSTVARNIAGSGLGPTGRGGSGGGVHAFAGTLRVSNSTFSENETGSGIQSGDGGGIYSLGIESILTNSTVSGNRAARNGGGISGNMEISFSTITGNVADADDDGDGDGGGLTGVSMPFRANILADNVDSGGEAPDCANFIFSGGYNVIGDMTGCRFSNAGETADVVGFEALLGPLADNGGPTLTHRPQIGSPAIALVPSDACEVATDQRGEPRGVAGNCDAGAVETDYVVTIDDLIEAVEQLVADGAIKHGTRTALISQLEASRRAANRGSTDAAAGILGAFLNAIADLHAAGSITDDAYTTLRALALAVLSGWDENPANKAGAADSVAQSNALPASITLAGNYPNPFNPTTTLQFAVPEAIDVRLTVYDVTGREMVRLVDGALPAGHHEVRLDATDWPSGLYLYRLEAGSVQHARKMILAK